MGEERAGKFLPACRNLLKTWDIELKRPGARKRRPRQIDASIAVRSRTNSYAFSATRFYPARFASSSARSARCIGLSIGTGDDNIVWGTAHSVLTSAN